MEKRLRKKKKSFLKKENTILPKIVLGRAVLWNRDKEMIKEDKQRQPTKPALCHIHISKHNRYKYVLNTTQTQTQTFIYQNKTDMNIYVENTNTNI